MIETSFGHQVPPFRDAFPSIFRLDVEVMSTDQLRALDETLPDETVAAMAACLRLHGMEDLLAGLSDDKRALLLGERWAGGEHDDDAFAALYPDIMVAINEALSTEQLQQVMSRLPQEVVASQSLVLGNAGRTRAFSRMRPGSVEVILNNSDDWVLLVTGKQALSQFAAYTATFIKQERIKGKLQKPETIQLKYREHPRAFYMKWVAGPFKGREVLYNEALLGQDRIRVREAGLLGIKAVTLGVDSVVAKRGSKHVATELGLKHLVFLMERDYHKGIESGQLVRINHGIEDLDGSPVFKLESQMPDGQGFYCMRMVHYSDFKRGFEVKCEMFDFHDRLFESFYYKDLDMNPGLGDESFDPKNRAYRL